MANEVDESSALSCALVNLAAAIDALPVPLGPIIEWLRAAQGAAVLMGDPLVDCYGALADATEILASERGDLDGAAS